MEEGRVDDLDEAVEATSQGLFHGDSSPCKTRYFLVEWILSPGAIRGLVFTYLQ